MLVQLLLGLRNDAQQVEMIQPSGSSRPVLGVREPSEGEEQRRLQALKRWGIAAQSPRSQVAAAIEQALPQRSQTILSHRLPALQQQYLNGAIGGLTDSRKHSQDPVTVPLVPET